MPNRTLKESICTSEDIAKLSDGAEILFYRLIVKADDYGMYHANPAIIRGSCFPLKSDDIKISQVESWLHELCDAGLITIYDADSRRYLIFNKWSKHQQIRAKAPKYPTPDSACNQMISDDITSPRISNTYTNTSTDTNTEQADKPPAHAHGEYGWVKLTETEYQRLVHDLGQQELDRCITYIDESAQQTGNKNRWKDWNLVVRKCSRERWGIKPGAQQTGDEWPGKANIPKAY